MKTQKTIILAGFSPYGDYPANSTELVANELHGKTLSGHPIRSKVFPATIPRENRGVLLLDEALDIGAGGIVCLGMSSRNRGFSIETFATNRIYHATYVAPKQNDQQIDGHTDFGESISIDTSAWQTSIFIRQCAQVGIFAEYSVNVSGFCCNHLMYQLRSASLWHKEYKSIPWIFMHVPCSPEAVPQPDDAFRQSGKVTITVQKIIQGLEILLLNASV